MSAQFTAVAELLELTLQYLPLSDVYSCSLFNRQFNICASLLLYRDLSFYLHPERYRHQDTSQEQLFTRLQSPEIITRVRHISIYFNKMNFGYDFVQRTSYPRVDYDFSTKMTDILRRATRLNHVCIDNVIRSIYDHSPYQMGHDDEAWDEIENGSGTVVAQVLEAVVASPNSPTVCLGLYHYRNKNKRWVDHENGNDVEGGDIALQLNEHQRVAGLAITDVGASLKLDFTLRFRHLTELDFYTVMSTDTIYESPLFKKTTDLARLFEHMPLVKLSLAYADVEFTSLPPQLQYLHLRYCDDPEWQIVCSLERLKTLKLFPPSVSLESS